jgi:hypothetical protein
VTSRARLILPGEVGWLASRQLPHSLCWARSILDVENCVRCYGNPLQARHLAREYFSHGASSFLLPSHSQGHGRFRKILAGAQRCMAIPKTQQLNRPTHESQRHLGTGKLCAVVETAEWSWPVINAHEVWATESVGLTGRRSEGSVQDTRRCCR